MSACRFVRSQLDRTQRRLHWLQCVCVCLWTDRRQQDVLDDGMGGKRRADAAFTSWAGNAADGEDGATYRVEVRCE